MKTLKKLVSHSALLLLICVTNAHAKGDPAQVEKEARFTYDVNSQTVISFDASNTEVSISTWEQNKVEVVARLVFKGKEDNRMTQFLEDFESEVNAGIVATPRELEISAKLDFPNKVQIGSRHVGVIISYDKDELDLRYELKVPFNNPLQVKNSYRGLTMTGEYTGQVEVNHYSGDFRGGMFQDLKLELKYGHAKIQGCASANITLYEQNLEMGSLGEARIEAKYSEIDLEEIGTLTTEGYETEYVFGQVNSVKGALKYSSITADQNIQDIDLESIYESKIEAEKVGEVEINESKYSRLTFDTASLLILHESYEDELTVKELHNSIITAKYLKLDIGQLGKSLELNVYEGDIDINQLAATCEQILLDGKYYDFSLDELDKNFALDVDVQYLDINMDESKVKRTIYIKEGSKSQMEANSIFEEGSQTKIIMRGYEANVTLK